MRNGLREVGKSCGRALAFLVASPYILSYQLKRPVLGPDRALQGSTQALAWLPGILGRYVRVAFLRTALTHCDPSASVEWGVLFSQSGAHLGRNAYIGPGCHLGLASIGEDVLLAAGVHVPSGPATHGTSRLDIPIKDQPGQPRLIRIGAGSWVGSASVVMADVGEHSVIGAGSVVTKPVPPFSFAAGVPAKVIRDRRDA